MSDDLNFQQLSTVQNNLQPAPRTIAAATTIARTTKLTRVTGTTVITTITPPVTGYHELTLVFSTGTASQLDSNGGNISPTTYTTITDRPVTLYYDPRTALYYIMTVA